MTGTTPSIAVIGAGLIGQRHAQLTAQHGRLVALVDPTDAAKAVAQAYGCPWYSDVETCLRHQSFDGAIVATPNHLHVPIGLELIGRGIPALIEKPIAATVAEAQTLIKASKHSGVPVLVGHHRRHNPIIKAAKSVIESGELGRLTLVDAKFWLYKPDDYYTQDWRTKAGAGPVFINLIHDIDLLRHLCGEVTDIQAIQSNAVRGFEVEDTAVVMLRFANGALGTISLSDTTAAPWSWEFTAGENPAYPHRPGPAYHIGGTDGALSVPDLKLWKHPGEKSWWAPIEATKVEAQQADALVEQFKHFLDVVQGKAQPLVTAESATESLKLIEAIQS
jgi:predicted dehydrogenase